MSTWPSRTVPSGRHRSIVGEVRRRGWVPVDELADLFGVSETTIRRDLELLHEAEQLVRVLGGARAIGSEDAPDPCEDAAVRQAIARRAAALVGPGAVVALAAGPTTVALAAELAPLPDLTVVTNSIPVARRLEQVPRHDRCVVVTGGIRTAADALVGAVASNALSSLHVDVVFMDVDGISEAAGFTTSTRGEALTNQAFVRAAERVVVLARRPAWGRAGTATIMGLTDADTLVTDEAPADAEELLFGRIDDVRTACAAPPGTVVGAARTPVP